MPIIRKAYAKINLCLDVLGRRENGYHDLRMIMQNIDLYDVLTFEKSTESGIKIMFKNLPENIDLGPLEKNLIYRAARLIMDEYGIDTGVIITLEKNIPVAAGMAGGSTDAAAVFHGLNELLALGMTLKDMCSLGVRIGADVPYCIMGETALSEGIGEILTPIANPPQCYLLIAKPNISVSTKYVYENLDLKARYEHPQVDEMISKISNQDLAGISHLLGNVLESVTINEYPVIEKMKHCMIENGAMGALMSGSGPTVFGIFDANAKGEVENAAQMIKENFSDTFVCVTTFINKN